MRNLRATSMVSLSWPWVKPGHPERDALESVPELAALVPHIERAHQGLLAAQGMSVEQRMAPLIEQIVRADGRHDSYWRTIYLCLKAYIELHRARGEHERAAALAMALATLMPRGLAVTQLSHREEVGEVKLLASRLTPALRALLAGIPMAGSDLSVVVDELIAAAEDLGKLEDQRAEVREQRFVTTMNAARHDWMRMITMLRSVLDVVEVSNPAIGEIMARIRDAEKQAARRADRADGDDSADDSDADSSPAAAAGVAG